MKNFELYFQYALASLIVIGFFSVIIVFMVCEIPVSNVSSINLCIGALIGAFTGIVGFYWGSSKGSKDKSEMIKNINDTTK